MPGRIKPPKVRVETIEDAYTYYVLILGIPEDVFWWADYSFVLSVADSKAAFDGWQTSAQHEAQEKAKQKAKSRSRR